MNKNRKKYNLDIKRFYRLFFLYLKDVQQLLLFRIDYLLMIYKY